MKSHGRLKSLFYGVVTDFGGTVLLSLSGIVVTPFILSYLSSTSYGFWMTILQVVWLLSILEVGAGVALVQKGADPAVSNDRERLSRLVTNCLVIQVITALVWLVTGLFFREYVFSLLHVNIHEGGDVLLAYTVMIVWLSVLNIAGLPAFLLIMRQRLALINGVTCAAQILATVGVVPLLSAGLGVVAFPVAQVFFGIVGAAVMFKAMRRHVPPFSVRMSSVNRHGLKEIMGFSLYIWLNKIAFVILTSSDNILIAATLGPASVTPFLMTTRLSGVIAPYIGKLSSSALPGFAELYATRFSNPDNYGRLQGAAKGLILFSVRVAWFGAALVAFCTERFVSLWVGDRYFCGMTFVILVTLLCFRDTIIKGISGIIVASGQLRGFSLISVIEAAAKIGLVLYLIEGRKMGLEGVLLGQFMATSLLSVLFFPAMVCRIVDLPARHLIKNLVGTSLSSLPAVAVLAVAMQFMPGGWGWVGLVLSVMLAGAINIACFELPRYLSGLSHPMSTMQRVVWAFRSQYL